MVTLGEVRRYYDPFRCEGVNSPEYQEKLKAVANAICSDFDIPWASAMHLPDKTMLGPTARQKFAEFRAWYDPLRGGGE